MGALPVDLERVRGQVQPLPRTGRVLGVDWGVKETATTTSDTHDLPHAQHGRKAQHKLSRYDRMMARRRPKRAGPPRRATARRRSGGRRLYAKIARQRQDTARMGSPLPELVGELGRAKRVCRDHDALAVEDFRPKFLAKTTMARKAADAAIGATKTALIEMGRKHGRDVRLVHPAHTTMDCASVRSENQARTAAVGTHLHLHRVRSRVPQGQELRPRDAGPGWSQPGWCRWRKTSGSAAPGGSLSQESPPVQGGEDSIRCVT